MPPFTCVKIGRNGNGRLAILLPARREECRALSVRSSAHPTGLRAGSGQEEPIRERPEEGDDGVFLLLGEAEVSQFLRVDVQPDLWRGPAIGAGVAGALWQADGQCVPRVVEVDVGLEALEVSILPVCVHYIAQVSLVHIA